jgi:hypothetical protein
MSTLVGVIAEDLSDVEVIEEIIAKKKNRRLFKIKKFAGHGCGKIRAKCKDWAYNLRIQQCTLLILIHDLDENNLRELRDEIEDTLKPSPITKYIIVIPIREIEAWLLADHEAINKTFGLKLKKIPNPEAIRRPKEHLRDLVYLRSSKRKIYVNTIHNRKIAAKANLKQLKRCNSFTPLNDFIQTAL